MRPIDELRNAGPEEKKRLESIFRDKEKYAAMESGERKELIKEYMFLQALEDPYFQKRRTKDRAAQQVYTYLNSQVMSPLQVQTGKKTNPVAYVLESLSHIKDGEFVLSEMQTNFVKDISYGTPITGGVSAETINKWSSYRESMRNDSLEQDRKKEIANEESSRRIQEEFAKKQAAEREAAEKKRKEEQEKEQKKEEKNTNPQKSVESVEKVMSGFRSDSSAESIEDIRRRLRDREKQLEAEKKEAQAQEEKRRREEEREKQIAERSRQRKEKKKLIIEESKLACKQRVSDLKLPNDSVLKKEFAKNEAEWARNKISKVNFNLLGKGSPQFDEMMESLNALKKYANRKNFDPAEYYDLQKKAIDKTRAYLQYKDEQLKNEPGRKEDPKRQAHEQPRIASAVQVLERLEQSYAEGKKALIDRTQEVAKIRLDEEMKKIGRLRMAGDVYSDGQFDKSYWQSLHLYDKMKQIESIAPGNPKEELSLKEYVAEVDNNLARELKQVDRRDLSSYQKNYLDKFRQNGYMDSHFDQVMSDEDFRKHMDTAEKEDSRLFRHKAAGEAFDPAAHTVKVRDEVADYQDRMFSDRTKAIEINGIDEHTADRMNSIGSIVSHSSTNSELNF